MKWYTGEARLDNKSPIFDAIRSHIPELTPLEIAGIWMRMDGKDNQFHMNIVLRISEEEWRLSAPASGLFNELDGSINTTMWEQKLGWRLRAAIIQHGHWLVHQKNLCGFGIWWN